MEFITGKTYNIDHTKKGSFSILVGDFDETFIYGNVTGRRTVRYGYNIKRAGDKLTLRRSRITRSAEQSQAF